jgi:hypothetical protein
VVIEGNGDDAPFAFLINFENLIFGKVNEQDFKPGAWADSEIQCAENLMSKDPNNEAGCAPHFQLKPWDEWPEFHLLAWGANASRRL